MLGVLILVLVAAADVPVSAGAEAQAAEIRTLINQLAISDKAAADEPILSPPGDAPASDPRMKAIAAHRRLIEIGPAAFPQLIASLEDGRQSVGFRRVLPSTVGQACYSVISSQLYALPPGYRGSFYRRGKDGEDHGRPVFLEHPFTRNSIKQWLADREGKSLSALQLEVLTWVLEKEEKIGAATPEDERRFLEPLRRKHSELKKLVELE
jgi:hypothetical protein